MKDARRKLRYYPIALAVSGRRILVVGGGNVAERKVESLLESKAIITVVAPRVTDTLARLASKKVLIWIRRPVRESDLVGARVAIAATNDMAVNKKVRQWANKKNILVNVVDNPHLCDFISPAIIRTDRVIVAVYTDGKDPVLSQDLKNFLQERWDAFLLYRRKL